jgi:hypothetical protein
MRLHSVLLFSAMSEGGVRVRKEVEGDGKEAPEVRGV